MVANPVCPVVRRGADDVIPKF